jgi:hypothetical protein
VSRLRFDPRRPLFVAQQFQANNKVWTVGSHFPWETLGYKYQEDNIHFLFGNNYLHHNPELEGEFQEIIQTISGDGLDSMTIEALRSLVDTINRQVRAKVNNPREYQKKKCATSTIKWRQIAKIRNWRAAYGHMEN